MRGEECIWVDKEFAAQWKELATKKATRDEQEKVFNEYLEQTKASIQREFRANLESLEEDSAIFTGLMLKVKQSFEKAKSEHLNASCDLWEKFETEIPSIQAKTDKLIEALKPLEKQLATINGLLGKISTHRIEQTIDVMSKFLSLQNSHQEMIEFLIKNFNEGRP